MTDEDEIARHYQERDDRLTEWTPELEKALDRHIYPQDYDEDGIEASDEDGM